MKKYVKLSPNQYGVIKGSGVNHFLIDTWHDILSHLEDHRAAAALVSIDFEKAFNRMNHQHCITALRAKGAPDHLVGMVQAFLYQRKMRVKVQGHMPEPRIVPPVSPQGSILANFLFCVTAEGLLDPPENSGNDFQANGSEHSVGSEPSEERSLSPIRRPDPPEHLRLVGRGEHQIFQTTRNISLAKLPGRDSSI